MKIKRHNTHKVKVGNCYIGGDAPIIVQSMTNTDTADVSSSVKQIIELYEAGSEIVRVTVNNDAAAAAIPKIHDSLLKKNYDIPLAGCFHYNGHVLLENHPACAEALAKYRINPGNVGFGDKRDKQFEKIIQTALKYNKPVRIGVNWGSLDQGLLTQMMDENSKQATPLTSKEILHQAMIESCLTNAKLAENIGLSANQIILSAKTSQIPDLISVYQGLASKSNYALHLGLTEAGMSVKGMVATSAALAILLSQGIGDTIRASITPKPGGNRCEEVEVCTSLLQSLGLRNFKPEVSACPGCGRTTSTYFQSLAQSIDQFIKTSMPNWKIKYPGVEKLKIAVMGCIVNGPGESKHADIGISLPGTGEDKIAPVFIEGKKTHTLRGEHIATEFIAILEKYIQSKFFI